MPAYVVRIHPKPIDDRPFGHLVDYSDNPDWQFSTFDAAAQWRDVLTGMKVAVGTHLCQFEVEEFKQRFFAVVCSSHPTKPDRAAEGRFGPRPGRRFKALLHTNVCSASRALGTPSPRQFEYVAVSRASHEASIFTDDMSRLGRQLSTEVSKTAALEINQSVSIGQGFEANGLKAGLDPRSRPSSVRRPSFSQRTACGVYTGCASQRVSSLPLCEALRQNVLYGPQALIEHSGMTRELTVHSAIQILAPGGLPSP